MMFFLETLRLRAKQVFGLGFVLALVLYASGVFAAKLVFSNEQAVSLRIGVVSGDGPVAAQVVKYFKDYLGQNGEIVAIPNAGQLERLVAAGSLECGFVVEPGIEDGFKNSITVYKSANTMAERILNVLLSSGIIQAMSGQLGYEVLKDFFSDTPKEQLTDEINRRTAEYAKSGPFMSVNYEISGRPPEFAKTYALTRTLYGLTATFALLLTFLVSMSISKERQSRVFDKLAASGAGGRLYFFYQFVFLFAFNFLFMSINVFLSEAYSIASLIISAAAYSFALAGLGVIIALHLPVWAFNGGAVLAFVGSGVFGGGLVNTAELAGSSTAKLLGVLRYFFVTHYFVEGAFETVPLLQTAGLIIFGGAALLVALRKV